MEDGRNEKEEEEEWHNKEKGSKENDGRKERIEEAILKGIPENMKGWEKKSSK